MQTRSLQKNGYIFDPYGSTNIKKLKHYWIIDESINTKEKLKKALMDFIKSSPEEGDPYIEVIEINEVSILPNSEAKVKILIYSFNVFVYTIVSDFKEKYQNDFYNILRIYCCDAFDEKKVIKILGNQIALLILREVINKKAESVLKTDMKISFNSKFMAPKYEPSVTLDKAASLCSLKQNQKKGNTRAYMKIDDAKLKLIPVQVSSFKPEFLKEELKTLILMILQNIIVYEKIPENEYYKVNARSFIDDKSGFNSKMYNTIFESESAVQEDETAVVDRVHIYLNNCVFKKKFKEYVYYVFYKIGSPITYFNNTDYVYSVKTKSELTTFLRELFNRYIFSYVPCFTLDQFKNFYRDNIFKIDQCVLNLRGGKRKIEVIRLEEQTDELSPVNDEVNVSPPTCSYNESNSTSDKTKDSCSKLEVFDNRSGLFSNNSNISSSDDNFGNSSITCNQGSSYYSFSHNNNSSNNNNNNNNNFTNISVFNIEQDSLQNKNQINNLLENNNGNKQLPFLSPNKMENVYYYPVILNQNSCNTVSLFSQANSTSLFSPNISQMTINDQIFNSSFTVSQDELVEINRKAALQQQKNNFHKPKSVLQNNEISSSLLNNELSLFKAQINNVYDGKLLHLTNYNSNRIVYTQQSFYHNENNNTSLIDGTTKLIGGRYLNSPKKSISFIKNENLLPSTIFKSTQIQSTLTSYPIVFDK